LLACNFSKYTPQLAGKWSKRVPAGCFVSGLRGVLDGLGGFGDTSGTDGARSTVEFVGGRR
jgi:hypothetical protein